MGWVTSPPHYPGLDYIHPTSPGVLNLLFVTILPWDKQLEGGISPLPSLFHVINNIKSIDYKATKK
jgi:hypothetical protein